jgi:NAD(P)-dependent dehydrogenase (short-subunit alcohol dehydrogenase family)
MSTSDTLKDRVALVTGGSRGIGYAIAEALLARGSKVVITGRDEARLASARERLAAADGQLEVIRADVSHLADVQRAVARTVAEMGGLDLLVNNAGVGRFAPLADMTDAAWHEVIGTNLTGAFYCSREAIPNLRARGGGWIINISSLAGKNWFATGAAYCASKAGLDALSEALMQEVRYDNIRVAYVRPGSVQTEFGGPTRASGGWKLAAEDVARVVIDLVSHPSRSLPSCVEIRPSQPPRKS